MPKIEKSIYLQIFGALMKNPEILNDTEHYHLSISDFEKRFERIVFAAIYNLYVDGAAEISPLDIDTSIQANSVSYKLYEENNGLEFLQDAENLVIADNFPIYYKRLKKLNALNDLKKSGYDISQIYPEDIVNFDEQKLTKFESMELSDIFNYFRKELTDIEKQYYVSTKGGIQGIESGIDQLLQELKEKPDIGAHLSGEIYNSIVRGARLGKYYIRSASSGLGKTRSFISDACTIAYPIWYNTQEDRWTINQNCSIAKGGKVLFIATEQDVDEIQTMVLSFLTGINEEYILTYNFTPDEIIRIQQAKRLMQLFKNNFNLIVIEDPSIEKIKHCIREAALDKSVQYVFYDYIFSSGAMLNEFRDLKVREDVSLMMFSAELKAIALELNIFISTATQVNASATTSGTAKTQDCIQSSKAIINKADAGCICTGILEEDKSAAEVVKKEFGVMPNFITYVYKLRRGKYAGTKIWSYFDLGTCRKKDLCLMRTMNNTPINEINYYTNEYSFELSNFYNDIVKDIQSDKPLFSSEMLEKIDGNKYQSVGSFL